MTTVVRTFEDIDALCGAGSVVGVMATQILVEQHVRELRAAAPATWNTLIAALTPLARRHVEPAFRLALGRELVQLLGPALEAAAPWLFEESQVRYFWGASVPLSDLRGRGILPDDVIAALDGTHDDRVDALHWAIRSFRTPPRPQVGLDMAFPLHEMEDDDDG